MKRMTLIGLVFPLVIFNFVSCGILTVKLPDLEGVPVYPDGNIGAYMLISNRSSMSYRNIELECHFKLLDNMIFTKNIHIEELPSFGRIEIRSTPSGDPHDLVVNCKESSQFKLGIVFVNQTIY
jgi:hypothetical protein